MFLNIQKIWQSPTTAYRGKPFWSWNGKLEREELLRQLDVFQQMGMGGAFLHSRTGLETEYLGEEWFDLINACADESAAKGLEAWLYDEDRWPSGSAGGKATEDPRFRMKYLRLRTYSVGDVIEWPDEEHFVAAFAAELNELHLGAYRQMERGAMASNNEKLLVFAWETMASHSFYNGNAYLDTMSAEATEHFMQLTHDAYAEKCGDRIGKSIKGIFTDEPHRGFVFCDVHGQPGPVETSALLPWTPKLPEAFLDAFGYDMVERLPELYFQKDGKPHAKIKWHYMELIQRLFLQNWAKPLQDRCHKLGMLLTGHTLHEDSLAAQAVPCGSMMRYYEYLDYPGVDILGNDNRNYWVVKQLASVSRQMNRPWMMSELYGCSGWQLCLDGHKRIGDWQALLGINIRCHHLSWYSMAGESKRDYPASISFQSAWYPEYEKVETYFSRLHVLLMAGKPLCDVLVLNPVESLWTRIHPQWATWLATKDEDIQKLETIYQDVFTWLMRAAIDFDYADEDHLARFGAVNQKSDSLQLGSMSYRVVIVAGMETMRTSTVEQLSRFQEAGGTVIFAGDPPFLVDAEPSIAGKALQHQCQAIPLEENSLVAAVRQGSSAAKAFSIESDAIELLCQVRQEGAVQIAVIINPSQTSSHENVRLSSQITGPVTELNCLRGECYAVEAAQVEGSTVWQTHFEPLQERVFVIGEAIDNAHAKPSESKLVCTVAIKEPLAYQLDEPNIAVLDFASFRLGDDTEWQSEREILQIEEAVCQQLDIPMRAGDMVQPWARDAAEQSAGKGVKTAPLSLRFPFRAESATPAEGICLVLERPELYQIHLNGTKVEQPQQTDWFIDPCFRMIPIPAHLLKCDGSANSIELTTTFKSGFDLEAIYLTGKFGVSLKGRHIHLGAQPEKLAPGDITTQGLPFYSGRIRYQIPAVQASALTIECAQAAAVHFRKPGSREALCMPWGPFQQVISELKDERGTTEVELVLTRRNTFGPLHLTPKSRAWIGPQEFRSKGENWSDDYQLYPAGLLAAHINA
jgi:hypothetical protein